MSSKPLQIKTINPDNVYGESVIYSQPIVSDTQPTIESLGTQLWEGLIWYNPTLNVTKMYINGEFLQINIEGGIDASYIVSGVLNLDRIPVLTDDKLPIVPITKGGTGATDISSARTNLGLGSISTYDVVSGTDIWGNVPVISSTGYMEVGKYIDFHATDSSSSDYDVRLYADSSNLILNGTLKTDNEIHIDTTETRHLVLGGDSTYAWISSEDSSNNVKTKLELYDDLISTNNPITIDISSTALTLDTPKKILSYTYKNSNNIIKTVQVIRAYGDSETPTDYNGIAIIGSNTGATIVSSGESAPSVIANKGISNNENIYLISDGTIELIVNASNNATTALSASSSGVAFTNGTLTRPIIYDATIRSGLNENTDASSYPRIEFRRSGNSTDKYRFSAVYYSDANSSGDFNTIVSKDGAFLPNHALKSSIEYASGNTFNFASTSPALFASGVLTSSLKDVYFNLPLPKNITNVTPTITALKGNIRCASGYLYPSSYITGGYDFLGDTTNFAVSIYKNSQFPNMLIGRINKPTAFTGFTNNQPINIEINAITISFA